MLSIETLLVLAAAFADHRNLSESRVSTLVFGDGTRLKHLRQGGEMGSRRVDRAISWFSLHWPANAEWPRSIQRPSISHISEAA